jgi:hypothetical protein
MRVSRAATLATIGVAIALAGCDGGIAAPNTDIGLTVWASAEPAEVSMRDTTLPIHIRVYVGNGSGDDIRVVAGGPPYLFTADPAQSRGLWGSYRIATDANPLNAGPGVDWWGQPFYDFEPGAVQMEEAVVTLASWKAGGWPLAPGRYRIRGWFNAREGTEGVLTITP